MQIVDAQTAAAYLRRQGLLAADERAQVIELAGGISNCVLYVERPDRPGADFVVKQARPQLRTADPWFCTVERIWREAAVLRWCGRMAPGDVPYILYEDRENYLFAMTAAPRPFETWKAELMRGDVRPERAARAGRLLGALHAGAWNNEEARHELGDRTLFHELRIDPYYRSVARAQPAAGTDFERLIASIEAHPHCLTHADFAPKNLLVSPHGMLLVDFETGHFGDGAFDLGFFLSHLVLKAFHHAPRHEPYLRLTEEFWAAYDAAVSPVVPAGDRQGLVARGILNFAGCAWARLDGTSKIDYLTNALRRDAVRDLCRWVFQSQPTRWTDVLNAARERLPAPEIPA